MDYEALTYVNPTTGEIIYRSKIDLEEALRLADRPWERSEHGLSFIDLLTVVGNQECPNPSVPWATKMDEQTKKISVFKLSCKKWDCPVCGMRNGRKWLARILDFMNKAETKKVTDETGWHFYTLTSHGKVRSPEGSLKILRHGWSMLRKKLAREVETLYYVRVWEFHEDGAFHMHALVNAPWTDSEDRLKDWAADHGMGNQAEVHEIENAGMAAGYVCKYLLKSQQFADRYPKGCRRIEVSRNWQKWIEYKSEDEVTLWNDLEHLARWLTGRKIAGYKISGDVPDLS